MTTIEELLNEIQAIPTGTTEYDLWKPNRVFSEGREIENESMVAAHLTMKMIAKGLYPYARVPGEDGATLRFSSDTNKQANVDERSTRV